jgi:hypothetical protein
MEPTSTRLPEGRDIYRDIGIYIGRGRERKNGKEGRERGRGEWEGTGARTVNRTKILLKSSVLLICFSS